MTGLGSDRHVQLTVGELSRRSGAPISTLHFYERQGLLASERTAGNQRRFRRDTLRRVAFIRVSQRVGIPLSEIKLALESLPDSRTPTKKDWARLSAIWKTELETRIQMLTHLRNDLTDCIGCGCLSLTSCALNNPADSLGTDGDGPRRW